MAQITPFVAFVIVMIIANSNYVMAQRFVDPYHSPQSTMGMSHHLIGESRFIKVIQNTRLYGYTILIKSNVSTVQECLYEAEYIVVAVQPRTYQSSMRMYRSVNYNGVTRTCEINNFKNKHIMAGEEVMVKESGWTYYEKDSDQEVQYLLFNSSHSFLTKVLKRAQKLTN